MENTTLIVYVAAVLIRFIIPSFLCFLLAKKQGRSLFWGATLGFLFPLISIIVYLVIGKTKKQQLLNAKRKEAKEVNKII